MNGAHDMGGTMGFGPVQAEADEPVFHHEWERRMFALSAAAGAAGGWNIDMGRFAREDRSPREYLNSTYYQLWYAGLVRLLQEHGLVTAEEIAAGRASQPPKPGTRTLAAKDVMPRLMARSSYRREVNTAPAFAVGDRVRARVISPRGHTRLPRYVRGKPGVVELLHGAHVFPDRHAHGDGEMPQFLYTVRFEAREVWGPEADPTLAISTNCWEPYLEPA